jgi:hypothetical protein
LQESVPRSEVAALDARMLELEASMKEDAKRHQEAMEKLIQVLNATTMENESLQLAIQVCTNSTQ